MASEPSAPDPTNTIVLPPEELAAIEADLRALGVTDEDIAEAADRLGDLYLVRTMWPGERKHSMANMARELDVSLDALMEFRIASGFAAVDPNALVGTERDLEFYSSMFGIEGILGPDQTMQTMRVLGAAVARIADAVTSTFLVNIDFPTRTHDLQVSSRATMQMVPDLVDTLLDAIEVLLRKHLVAARRYETTVDMSGGYEIQQLAVGFADLAGSTALAERLSFAEIGPLLLAFENTATSIVTRYGGRVVKLIGDEVLFTADTSAKAARIAWAISTAIADIADLPDVRVGVAGGEILTRDGDVFGPPVNRAARIVKACEPGSVVVSPDIRLGAKDDFTFVDVGDVVLPGFSEPCPLWAIEAAQHPIEPIAEAGDFE